MGGLETTAPAAGGPDGGSLQAVLLHKAAAPERSVPKSAGEPAPLPPRYYRTSELDVAPGIMTRVDPEYPGLVHVGGRVTIRLFIDERGNVENVAILRAEPPGYFEASARRAFLAARFTPGMKGGAPVKAQLTLQVDYAHPR